MDAALLSTSERVKKTRRSTTAGENPFMHVSSRLGQFNAEYAPPPGIPSSDLAFLSSILHLCRQDGLC